jgi:hypothetical protein
MTVLKALTRLIQQPFLLNKRGFCERQNRRSPGGFFMRYDGAGEAGHCVLWSASPVDGQ